MTVVPENDTWKDHLGFTSGTVLVWAFLLMKLLPVAAAMQLPNNLWGIDEQGSVIIDFWIFLLLTLFGAVGITGMLVGTLHIGVRGLWLASKMDQADTERAITFDMFCRKTFVSVFSMAKFTTVILPIFLFCLAVSGLQLGMHRLLAVNSFHGGVELYIVASAIVGFMLVSVVAIWQRHGARTGIAALRSAALKILSRLGRELLDPEGLSVGPVLILVSFLWVATFSLSYQAELSVSKTIYDNTTPAADIQVHLGGATSEVKKLRLALVNSEGDTIRTLKPFDLGTGNYAVRVELSGLSPGRYGVILAYPYIDVSLVPFRIHRSLIREKWFLVLI
jgi:hypothetical protein